jgi:hypothetical protein
MPELPAVPNACRVSLLWTDGNDNDLLTRLYFAYAGTPPDGETCELLAEDIRVPMVTRFQSFLNIQSYIRGVDFVDLSSVDGASGTALGAPTVGTRTGNYLPAGAAVLVNHTIARRYRGGKPRSYLPLFTAPDMNGPSKWDVTAQANLQTAFRAFQTDVAAISELGTALAGPISISYFNGYAAPRPRSNGHLMYPSARRPTPHVDPILSSSVNSKPGSQRRRNLH